MTVVVRVLAVAVLVFGVVLLRLVLLAVGLRVAGVFLVLRFTFCTSAKHGERVNKKRFLTVSKVYKILFDTI